LLAVKVALPPSVPALLLEHVDGTDGGDPQPASLGCGKAQSPCQRVSAPPARLRNGCGDGSLDLRPTHPWRAQGDPGGNSAGWIAAPGKVVGDDHGIIPTCIVVGQDLAGVPRGEQAIELCQPQGDNADWPPPALPRDLLPANISLRHQRALRGPF
jgi:hypothetical protein